MAERFTPGPWNLWVDSTGAFDIRELPRADTIPEGVVICSRSSHANEEEGIANAYLIAAAPDLYEALKGWQTHFDDITTDNLSVDGLLKLYDALKSATDAALSKAHPTQGDE